MNKIKTISLFLITLLMMTLAACTKDEQNTIAESTDTVAIAPQSLEFPVGGGTSSFTVTGGTAFVRSNNDWITVTRTSGDKKTSTFEVVCSANKPETEGGAAEARTGSIIVNLDGAYVNYPVTQQGSVVAPEKTYTFRTAQEIAKEMYPGWNLGNTLEATSSVAGLADETGWQSTKTTQEVIDFVKAQGFKSVRIPCSWSRHMDANQNINMEWMARVKEIVDYCINDGLYVVLNDHYDEGWLEKNISTYDPALSAKLQNMWAQIGNAFQNYDEHLLFAGLNEPDCGTQATTDNLVKYENDFIAAVRATKGNNANRVLVVQGPSTDIDKTQNFYNTVPTDSKANALMVEVHYYNPPQFSGVWENGTPFWFWGAENLVSGDSHNATSDESYLAAQLNKMYNKFVKKNIPVIIGEYGANWRSIGAALQPKHDASIKLYNKLVCQYSVERGMVPFVWDINVANQQGETGIMTVINRSSKTVFCTPAMEGITEGCKATWMSK